MKKIIRFTPLLLLLLLASAHGYGQQVRNVILLIGDGMGLGHVQTTMMRGDSALNLERAQYIGLAKTYSANNRVTDSAAAGTALATGHKTNNSMVGVTPDGKPVENIRERAQAKGLATGIVVTHDVTDATPAAFMAHRTSRKMAEEIALDITASGVDVLIGGGHARFASRKDGADLIKKLESEGYRVVGSREEMAGVKKGKLVGLLADGHLPKMKEGRGNYLPEATPKAISLLGKDPDGFFLMVEGSQIDKGGHANDGEYIVGETLDFDRAVGVAFNYADKHPGTLVIVTADHETGGLTIPSGSDDFLLGDQGVELRFSTKSHTGIMVPVYAYGTGADNFSTIMQNTDIPQKIVKLLGLE